MAALAGVTVVVGVPAGNEAGVEGVAAVTTVAVRATGALPTGRPVPVALGGGVNVGGGALIGAEGEDGADAGVPGAAAVAGAALTGATIAPRLNAAAAAKTLSLIRTSVIAAQTPPHPWLHATWTQQPVLWQWAPPRCTCPAHWAPTVVVRQQQPVTGAWLTRWFAD